MPIVIIAAFVAACGSAAADPLPADPVAATPERGTAYPQFSLHLLEALNEYVTLADSIPSMNKPKAYARWLDSLQDWAADEIAYTTTHPPLECYQALWENHDRIARLVADAADLLEDGIVRLDADTIEDATMTMRQVASLSEDTTGLASEATAACA